ncbi:hypothetical protein B0H67DRAFT_551628 [Lasiosphaeris hirsuta]|uniref:Uncharacterized protein n=1 Tax=Lasiosphaeris hirsuta TaxID=260670 RepID=A0AA40DZY4_9PEZI|nr:hypothetical protein B0H67DRAFT_551628 [Lasiosphaeris hirsuta]
MSFNWTPNELQLLHDRLEGIRLHYYRTICPSTNARFRKAVAGSQTTTSINLVHFDNYFAKEKEDCMPRENYFDSRLIACNLSFRTLLEKNTRIYSARSFGLKDARKVILLACIAAWTFDYYLPSKTTAFTEQNLEYFITPLLISKIKTTSTYR